MKVSISRQNIYLVALSTFLLIFVLLFSFLILVPKGKEYRVQKTDLYKENVELKKYQDFHEQTLAALKKLQSDNRLIIAAFDNSFNAKRFEKEYKNYFKTLTLSKLEKSQDNEGEFLVYAVETTSNINSPKNFYDFLDALNKGSWIIGVNFPIHFKRQDQLIRSSFTMKVYSTKKDLTASK